MPDEDIVSSILSTADVGLSPDPKNPLNDVSTMNKSMEYMAFGLPVIAFDLRETRVSVGEAGVYVMSERRARLCSGDRRGHRRRTYTFPHGEAGTDPGRAGTSLEHQRRAYLDVYRDLLGKPAPDQGDR